MGSRKRNYLAAFLIIGTLFSAKLSAAPEFTQEQKKSIHEAYSLNSNNLQENSKDLLFIFINKNGSEAQFNSRVQSLLKKEAETNKKLSEIFHVRIIELDNRTAPLKNDPGLLLADRFGLLGTPCVYLTDKDFQPYARYLGGFPQGMDDSTWITALLNLVEKKTKRDELLKKALSSPQKEREPLLIEAISSLPAECIPGCYPKELQALLAAPSSSPVVEKWRQEKKKYEESRFQGILLAEWESPSKATKENVEKMLKLVNSHLEQNELSPDAEAYLLVNYRFPLLVHQSRFIAEEKGKGVFSAESDRIMRMALDDLNKAIKLAPDSPYGKEAQRLKRDISAERRKLP